ncbi:vacuolar protein sorting-associated protein 54, chloroplastic-like isoform X2 [Impatiens glandulifera]|uniref:vacuolar protein sorting-associated protein 54, chloroplastic-like isoform X2 n=1 Tax=Impatiens glandulifera TaxID=253017 RepID=UPI001FB0C23A|nr:vacuolar protein sorting-associated protein 54, chloroplastic-like isoform X2 [Impatiens glandulifera]
MDSQPSQSGRFFDQYSTSCNSFQKSSSFGRNDPPLSKSISDVSANNQSLASILNNPHGGKSGVYGSDASWVGWFSSSTAVSVPEFAPLSGSANKPGSEVGRIDFQPYLATISESHSRFADIQEHRSKEYLDFETSGGPGEALVACLREVPALYFKEDFALEDGATFGAACPFSTVSENVVLQEKLSQHLDVVEFHLVKEIALRSNSFFEAQGQLQDLNMKIVEGCTRIRGLKETIRLLDAALVASAQRIQEFNAMRNNFVALHQKLCLILYVNQALSTLKLLVGSADCAGALDVTDDLKQLLDGDELTGLHCFRHLRDHVATSMDSINTILSAEFIHTAISGSGNKDVLILSKAKAGASVPTNRKLEVVLDEEELSNFSDCLLPHIIGLLRTGRIPHVLRIYRDTLTADMKNSIKTAVAELLPFLLARPFDPDVTAGERVGDTDGGGSSLASKLKSLSSESFVILLGAIFSIVQIHLVRAAEVKKSIEWIMSNLNANDTIAVGAAAAENTAGQDSSLLLRSSPNNATNVSSLQGRTSHLTSSPSISKNFRADVLRENTEAVFAACDAAHGRWAKLIGVRATVHPKLRLVEFINLYNITQEFITMTEKIGGRLGYSIRGTLQSQAKAFVDSQHESRMSKIRAVLDQEKWTEVEGIPDEFQVLVNSLLSSEALDIEHSDDAEDSFATSNGEVVDVKGAPVRTASGSLSSDQHNDQAQSVSTSSDGCTQVQSPPSEAASGDIQTNAGMSSPQKSSITVEQGKALSFKGLNYHLVNSVLILLKTLSEYVDMNNCLPALSSEVVHRAVEILKFFNTRTCQLVLGAGAMQVSGLKSINSKHLALASQAISFIHAVIPGECF